MKKIRLFVGFTIFLVVFAYGILLLKNNREAPPLEHDVLIQHFEKSVRWMTRNQEQVLSDPTPMLWWMVIETAKKRPDPRLISLIAKYIDRYPSVIASLWGPLFGRAPMRHVDPEEIIDLPYYNKHIIYALHGAENLALTDEVIRRQNEANFCHQLAYFFRPACTTHQLLGIHFLGQKADVDVEVIIDQLQQDIIHQLTWDVRVVDVYLQRVMLLVLTGAKNKVKASWTRQILNYQLDDGGWTNSMPLFPLGNGRFFGFGSRLFSFDVPSSSFHATAQGMFLLAMMAHK